MEILVKCEHPVSHPNMGVLFRKGKNYVLTEINQDEDIVVVSGMKLYIHLFEYHFSIMTKDECQSAKKIIKNY